MSILEALFLGVVQGLTEFLPVSSSGHLVLFQKLFGLKDVPLLFDTLLHCGTLLAVFVALWDDIWPLIQRPFQKTTYLVIVATLPTVVIALLFKDSIETAFSTGAWLGWGFLLTTTFLLVGEILSRRFIPQNTAAETGTTQGPEAPGVAQPPVLAPRDTAHHHKGLPIKDAAQMGYLRALFVGLMQGIAIFPAISRSGSTIAGGLMAGCERSYAGRFSFLMAIPAIPGALVFQLKDIMHEGPGMLGAVSVSALVVGTAAAAITGFLAIKLLLRILQKGRLWGFACYTGLLALLILLDQYLVHLVF
ncbi:MAG TPA: undecaprenyl-diphosphate phosphatase [Termitinemataceae bacterium]|nr:undecaprenyl-diphosphate phosphatase [Termitinemataceae bacterium]HOM23144.1 undecaprenyl-diphosphate phosphatase [Termitinemataceae bacterium]HPQ00333.1 undecaprenyl-diphosphate phosphatase [Termitinemataceae bacterium]